MPSFLISTDFTSLFVEADTADQAAVRFAQDRPPFNKAQIKTVSDLAHAAAAMDGWATVEESDGKPADRGIVARFYPMIGGRIRLSIVEESTSKYLAFAVCGENPNAAVASMAELLRASSRNPEAWIERAANSPHTEHKVAEELLYYLAANDANSQLKGGGS